MGESAYVELDEEQEARADRLHRESLFFDALVAGADAFLTDPDYQDHLGEAGVDVGNFTVGGPSDSFDDTVGGVVETREKVRDNDDRYLLVEDGDDIERAADSGRTGVVLGFQGCAGMGKSLDRIRAFHELGVRVIDLTYNRQNYLGTGCCEGAEGRDSGLTMLGREAIDVLNERGVVVDTAHDADQTTVEVAEYSADPVIQSHIGCRELCPSYGRAKTDEQLRVVADNGGVNAITPFPPVIKQDPETHEVLQATIHDVLDHIDYAVDVGGVDSVAFGADMSDRSLDNRTMSTGSNLYNWRPTHPEVYGAGSTEVMDPYPEGLSRYTELRNLTRGLVARGYDDDEVEAILGENLLRVFETVVA
jgi:membrane dipeptidase